MAEAVSTYEGSCHCGAVHFRVKSAPIRTGLRCNCSICIRRGTVMSSRYVPSEDFEWVSGREALRRYQLGDRMMREWTRSRWRFGCSTGAHSETAHAGEPTQARALGGARREGQVSRATWDAAPR